MNIEEYFIPIDDLKVPLVYKTLIDKYRMIAGAHGVPVTVPICYWVKAGFTLKCHTSQAGHWKRLDIMKLDFEDKPTENSTVFWVPRTLAGTIGRNTSEQLDTLSDFRINLGLPDHHLLVNKKASLVAGLIFSHFKHTGKRVPGYKQYVRTGSLIIHETGDFEHVCFGDFDSQGLSAFLMSYTDSGRNTGVFAIGVEKEIGG